MCSCRNDSIKQKWEFSHSLKWCCMVQELQTLLLILWHWLDVFSAARVSGSKRCTEWCYWWLHSRNVLVMSAQILTCWSFSYIGVSAESCFTESCKTVMGKIVIVENEYSRQDRDLACSLLQRFQSFSCVTDLPITFHILVYISSENRVTHWSWLNADMHSFRSILSHCVHWANEKEWLANIKGKRKFVISWLGRSIGWYLSRESSFFRVRIWDQMISLNCDCF